MIAPCPPVEICYKRSHERGRRAGTGMAGRARRIWVSCLILTVLIAAGGLLRGGPAQADPAGGPRDRAPPGAGRDRHRPQWRSRRLPHRARLGHPPQHRSRSAAAWTASSCGPVPGRPGRAGQGELLAEIDPRPFETQLTQVEAQLAKDEAALSNASMDLERYRTLVKGGFIPQQQMDTQASTVAQLAASIKSDQGQHRQHPPAAHLHAASSPPSPAAPGSASWTRVT